MTAHPRGNALRRRGAGGIALGVLVALVAAGCGSSRETMPTVSAAPPQRVALDWEEPVSPTKLTFGVQHFEVTASGWRAKVSVSNQTQADLVVGTTSQFGVMLFRTGEPDELDQRNAAGELPAVRSAVTFQPPLPAVVPKQTRWTGTISAPGALAAGRFVRIVFGPFLASESASLPTPLIWITDHTYRLRS